MLSVFLVLGLLNVFGQQPRTSVARASEAVLRVTAPTSVRGGLFYEGRIEIEARREIPAAVIVLDTGWLDETSINTITPEPTDQRSADGRLEIEYGSVSEGERLVVRLQAQVNPGFGASRSQGVELRDGARRLARVDRRVVTYP